MSLEIKGIILRSTIFLIAGTLFLVSAAISYYTNRSLTVLFFSTGCLQLVVSILILAITIKRKYSE